MTGAASRRPPLARAVCSVWIFRWGPSSSPLGQYGLHSRRSQIQGLRGNEAGWALDNPVISLHRDHVHRAPGGAKPATDALSFVFEHGRTRDDAQLLGCDFVEFHTVQLLIAPDVFHRCGRKFDLLQRHQAQAVFRADIHASPAQDAARSVILIAFKNRIDPAAQAALRLAHSGLLVVSDFHLGHAGSSFERQHGHRFAAILQVTRNHLMALHHFDFDVGIRIPRAPKVLVYSHGDSLAVADAIDDQTRSEYAIAA